jgi:hypothetical protein
MKTLYLKQSNWHPMVCLNFLTLAMALALILSAPLQAVSGERDTFEGTLRGASCTHYKQDCYDDDAHIAIENDFVLVLADDLHYFMPNLSRALKARYANKVVRVSGDVDKKNHSIWVDTLELKKGNEYQPVWSWKEQQELYKGGGG